MKTHDYQQHAKEYAELGIEGSYFLAFRDIPKVIEEQVNGKKALDYGCGSGRSTRWLKGLGLEAIGIDISPDMLEQAREKDPGGSYYELKDGVLPFEDEQFDLVFSSFVFLEVASLSEMEAIFAEFKRVLKPKGYCIFITTSEDGYKGNWLSLVYDFPENQGKYVSGDKVKLQLRGTNVVLYDYYWTDKDFRAVFEAAGLDLQAMLQPIGETDDGIAWRDELRLPPWSIYVLQKAEN